MKTKFGIVGCGFLGNIVAAVPEKCSAAQMENWKKLCRRRHEKV